MFLARIISLIFNPIIIPFYTLLIILNLDFYTAVYMSMKAKISLSIMVMIMTFALPVIALFVMRHTGFVSTLYINDRKERTIPYTVTAGFYYICFHALSKLGLPSLIPLLVFGGTVTILLTLTVNFFWKISAHMVACGGVTGLFAGLSALYGINILLFIITTIITSGLIAWSRLKLNAHTPAQVYAGFFLGAASMIGLLWINY